MASASFTKQEMLDVLDSEGVVVDEIVDTTRWSIVHHLIFKKDSKLYETHYSRGATEYQDEGPWEYDDTVDCVEVEEYQKTVVAYRPVTD